MEAYHCGISLRRPGSVLLAAWLFTAAGLLCHAQSSTMHQDADSPGGAAVAMPDAPGLKAAEEPAGGVICGTVLDTNGAEVEGATVVLEGGRGRDQRDARTDGTGFFKFSSVAPGSFKVVVTAKGFSDWSSASGCIHRRSDTVSPAPRAAFRIAGRSGGTRSSDCSSGWAR